MENNIEQNVSKNKRKRKKKKNKLAIILQTIFMVLIGLVVSGLLIFGLIFLNWLEDLPELDLNKLNDASAGTLIYDKNDNFITTYSYGVNKEWTNSEEIPKALKDAVVAIEDKNFYKHKGIYYKRLLGATLGQITGKGDYGGSTITQQLIKNVYLTAEVSYKRKAQELILARKLEKKLTKDEILTSYLNVIYMGGNNYGVKSAAKSYFGKELNELNLKEIALIAGLPKNPNGYNPKRNLKRNTLDRSYKRAETVLYVMHEQGKISDNEYEKALKEEFVINDKENKASMYPHPHFIEYMINEIAYDMAKQKGDMSKIPNIKEDLLSGGYIIHSNMDLKAQNILEESVHNYKNYPDIIKYDKNKFGEQVAEAASVIIDRESGGICAIVGGRDVPQKKSTYNRAVHSMQPVGSIVKPLSIFAPAIDKGMGSGNTELDIRTPIIGYDDNKYPGGTISGIPLTMRKTMDLSRNVAAARFLYDYVGDDLSLEYLYKMGIKASRPRKTGQSLVLGNFDSTVMEMARAYSVFINNGKYVEPKTYKTVTDKQGNVILDASDYQYKREVFNKSTVYIMNEMFKSEANEGTGLKARVKGITTGGKTGTHEDRVITYAGMTPYYLSVVRISNDKYLSMQNAWGGVQAAGLFSDYMTKLHSGLKDKAFQSINIEEAGVKKVKVSKLNGKLATAGTDALGLSTMEYYKNPPKEEDNTVIAVCERSGNLVDQTCFKEKCVKYKLFAGKGSGLEQISDESLKQIVKTEILREMPKPGGHKKLQEEEDKKNQELINKELERDDIDHILDINSEVEINNILENEKNQDEKIDNNKNENKDENVKKEDKKEEENKNKEDNKDKKDKKDENDEKENEKEKDNDKTSTENSDEGTDIEEDVSDEKTIEEDHNN